MKNKSAFILIFFMSIFGFSQENSKEIIIPEVNLVDTVNSAKNYAHFRNTLRTSNLADNIYGIKFSGIYTEGIKESLLNGTFDFIVKEVRIRDIVFKSSLTSDNYDKITNALKVMMIVVLSHRNLLVTNRMFFKYRCEDLGGKKWSFRFVKSEKERVNLEDSARHFFIVQLNNQGQIEMIESKSLNSQFNDDYHFVSKYKSSVEGISLEKIDATFINSQNHNTLRLSLELTP